MMTLIWRYRELVAIAVLLALLWFSFQWGNSQRIQKEENAKGLDAALLLIDEKDLEITQYKNELGNSVTIIQNQELDRKNFEKIAKLERFNLEKSFNVKIKNIESITTFKTKSKLDSLIKSFVRDTSIHRYISSKDTSNNLRLFEYKDPFNNLRFWVDDSSRHEQTDSISGIDVRSRPKRWFWKLITFRKWKETSTYQITNRNDLVEINDVIKMQVARKR